jgi:hypothetical protein
MWIRRITALLCALIGSVPAYSGVEPETNISGGPPELCVAVIVDDHTLELSRFVERMVTRTTTSNLPPGVKAEVKEGSLGPTSNTEVVPVVETRITRVDATTITAWRIDGRAVSVKVLMAELAKPSPVILVKQGRKVDPLFAKMFKADTLVLQLSSSTTPPTVAPNSTTPSDEKKATGTEVEKVTR